MLAFATTLLGVTALPAFTWVTPAQSATDELLRQQARERALREQQERISDVRLPKPETPQGFKALAQQWSRLRRHQQYHPGW